MSKLHGEFLHIVGKVQDFLQSKALSPYSESEEADYSMGGPLTEDGRYTYPYFGFEIDETEGNRGGFEGFYGFITILLIINDGVDRDVKMIEIPSDNGFPEENAENRYSYDIDYADLYSEIEAAIDAFPPRAPTDWTR